MTLAQRIISSFDQISAISKKENADVVSIDLFDTLVFRACANPNTVFSIQYARCREILGPRFTSKTWIAARKASERIVADSNSPREITLTEIYHDLAKRHDFSPAVVAALMIEEQQVEAAVIRPYEDVVSVLRELRREGKTICITTDIYLPGEFIHSVLARMLDFPFEMLCSSETGQPKRTGGAFRLLRSRFSDKRIVHFGDNPRSDMHPHAASEGIPTILVAWPRAVALTRNRPTVKLLEDLNILTFSTPFDAVDEANAPLEHQEMAWRWAAILVDFCRQAAIRAAEINADEVWFLSRDCEVLFQALQANPALFEGRTCRYVFASRAATYPIMAVARPKDFERWTKRPVTDTDVAVGKDLMAAYLALPEAGTKKILLIDIGWKARICEALSQAIPDIAIQGFYFSLDPKAEPQAAAKSHVFLQWSPSVISQAGAEALMGYTGPSCIGYRQSSSGVWEAQFRPGNIDSAPEAYHQALLHFSREFFGASQARHPAQITSRRSAVRSVLAFPDAVAARAFQHWGISVQVSGEIDTESMVSGGGSSFLVRLMGIHGRGNVWPQIAMWSISGNPKFVRILQVFAAFNQKYTKPLIGFVFHRSKVHG